MPSLPPTCANFSFSLNSILPATVGQRVNSNDGELPVSNGTMTSHTRSRDPDRLSEWAALTGDRLPEEYGDRRPDRED